MTRKAVTSIVVIIILIILGVGAYWYFIMRPFPTSEPIPLSSPSGSPGFQPINRPVAPGGQSASTTGQSGQTSTNQPLKQTPIPVLRLLSATPVGGYGSMTTASTTIAEWIGRGRGNVYQADEKSSIIATLSNTVVPRMYQSLWNKSLTAFIGSLLQDGGTVGSIYAELVHQTATSSASAAPFSLRGKDIPGTMIAYAASPKKDQVFMLENEGGNGVGYVSAFNGSSMTKIFTTPLTQVSVDWPSANTIAITTKGSATADGFLYFVNPKTGVWTKVLGPLAGLSATVSHDGKYVLASVTGGNNNVLTSIYSIAKASTIDAGIRTLADKCAWGNFYQDVVYCGVSSLPVSGTYPDDWYTGTLSTSDKIWQVDAATGEVRLIASLPDQTTSPIDAFALQTDDHDNYLFFMNKKDLSLWSLNLIQSH